MSDYIQTLNPTQHDAVVNYQGASLIIAGAGSGKTRVLTCRIAYMLSQGVPASSILALTFTNKAAREMRERIDTLVPGGMSRRLWMSTFHSIFARILRAEADKLGYPSSFTIYDASDAKNLVFLTRPISPTTLRPASRKQRTIWLPHKLTRRTALYRPKIGSCESHSSWTFTSSICANAAKMERWILTTCCSIPIS